MTDKRRQSIFVWGGSARPKLASDIVTYCAQDEVDAFYINRQVKRENRQIRKNRREAKKRKEISLAIMPWD